MARRHNKTVSRRPGSQPATGPGHFDRRASGASTAVLSLLVIVPALALGARYAWGQLLIAVLATAWLALWLTRGLARGWIEVELPAAGLILVCGAALGLVQCLPMAGRLVQAISPKTLDLLPFCSLRPSPDGEPAGQPWRYLSLAPARTGDGLLLFLTLAAVWWLAVQQLRSASQVRELMGVLFAGGVTVALFAIVQRLFGNGKYFWSLELPGLPAERFLRGTFTNRNHFGGWLALTVGPACYWLCSLLGQYSPAGLSYDTGPSAWSGGRGHRRTPRSSYGRSTAGWKDLKMLSALAGLGLILGAVLWSHSRGAILAASLALITSVAGLAAVARRGRWAGLLLVTICLVLAACLCLPQLDSIAGRMTSLQPGRLLAANQNRLTLWAGLLKAAQDFPLLGTGFGSLSYLVPVYMPAPLYATVTHAENCYLQLWVEGGAIALALCTLGLAAIGSWLIGALRFSQWPVPGLAVATGSGLLAAAVHAGADFVWYVPAYAVLVALLAAAAFRLGSLASSRRRPVTFRSRIAGAGVWLAAPAAVLLAVTLLCHFVARSKADRAWLAYLRCLKATQETGQSEAPQQRARRIALLTETLRHRPADAEAHLRLGHLYAARAAASDNPSPSQDKLRARQHYRAAVSVCPLLGQAYLGLAKLEPDPAKAARYAIQAVLVRPHQPYVCFGAGFRLFQLDRPAAALTAWRLAAARSWDWERLVLDLTGPYADADTLVRYLAPSTRGLAWAAEHCCDPLSEPKKRRQLLKLAAQRIQSGDDQLDQSTRQRLLEQLRAQRPQTQSERPGPREAIANVRS